MHRRRALTLIEVAIGTALLVILAGMTFVAMLSTTQSVDLAAAVTESQLQAERITRTVVSELRRSEFEEIGLPPPAGNVRFSVAYKAITQVPPFDPANPQASETWTSEDRVIAFEEDGDPVDGADDDGDLIVDEGRVVLYRDTDDDGVGDVELAVLGRNVSGFTVSLAPAQGAGSNKGLPSARVEVEVRRVNYAGIKTAADRAAAIAANSGVPTPGQPRLVNSHTTHVEFVVVN